MKIERNKILLIIMALILPSLLFGDPATTTTTTPEVDLPSIVVNYGNVVKGIISQVIVGLVIVIMLVFSAWEMKVNGNASPLKWALFASIIMASAVYFAPNLISFAGSSLNDTGEKVYTLTEKTP